MYLLYFFVFLQLHFEYVLEIESLLEYMQSRAYI